MAPAVVPATENEKLVSSFLELAVGQTAETATRFLEATNWMLEDAIQLFYVENECSMGASSEFSPLDNDRDDRSISGLKETGAAYVRQHDEDFVRAPLPVTREILYGNAIPDGSTLEMERPGIWESDPGATSGTVTYQENLASLYRPPLGLMHKGPFEEAKDTAKFQDKWFLVNLQSTTEFSSHMLNRDTWGDEAVSQTIQSNFIFWQVYNDTDEGRKVCNYYKLESFPVVLVIDPVTGQKMRSWRGMIQPEDLLEDLVSFMDESPKDHYASLSRKRRESSYTSPQKLQEIPAEPEQAVAASMENIKIVAETSSDNEEVANSDKEEPLAPPKPEYPPLPEEPKGDKNLICRVGIRLPDGRRFQRSFLRSDPIQLLWSFCYHRFTEGDIRPFGLTQAIPGASKHLDYGSNLTFDESGLANSMISVTWV